MNIEELIRRYIDAWNARDLDSILELMHPGAAYYDAFWMETCVGRDLADYLRDSMDSDDQWYVLVDDIITTEHGAVFRYHAHDYSTGTIGDVTFNGAEILKIHNDKILTVSNIYCSPSESELRELAELTAARHGLTRHANDGLTALSVARIEKRLAACLDDDRIYLDPDMTAKRAAELIGCTKEQLRTVVKSRFRTKFRNLLDWHRVEYAKQLLLEDVDKPRLIDEIAAQSGFRTVKKFRDTFAEIVGATPRAYRRRQRHQALPN